MVGTPLKFFCLFYFIFVFSLFFSFFLGFGSFVGLGFCGFAGLESPKEGEGGAATPDAS